jgi:hypothetical protein
MKSYLNHSIGKNKKYYLQKRFLQSNEFLCPGSYEVDLVFSWIQK